jgi:hypothetical protein
MRRTALPLLAALLLAACQPSASASPSEEPSVAPSEPAPSEAPASASGAAACDPGTICNGPLEAGDYVSETTGARIEFSVDDHGWSGIEDTPGDGFGLFLADLDGAHAISVVAFSGEIFANSCDPDAGTLTLEAIPSAFMNMLTTREGITASPPVEVEVGGMPALQTDLTTSVDVECEATGGGRIWLWTLPVHGDFHFNSEETARVIAVNAESATVILVVEAFADLEDYDHLLEHATEVFDSMTITPL